MAEVKLTRWDVIDYLDTEEDMALCLCVRPGRTSILGL